MSTVELWPPRRQARGVGNADRAVELAARSSGGLTLSCTSSQRAVVAALGLGDERPAREGARDAHGDHHGLGAGVGEADALDRVDALAQDPRQPARVLVGRGEEAPGRTAPDRLDDARMGMAVDERACSSSSTSSM